MVNTNMPGGEKSILMIISTSSRKHTSEDYLAEGIYALVRDKTDICSLVTGEPSRDVSFHFFF